MNKREIGSGYEEMAAAYLIEQGYKIVARNFSGRRGEIDIIARDGEYLVFVEVKYRRDETGQPRGGGGLQKTAAHPPRSGILFIQKPGQRGHAVPL